MTSNVEAITIIDTEGNEHQAEIILDIKDCVDALDVEEAITDEAINWCSRNGYAYETWE
jgi:uncharacterized protein YrzB (UPF0473 family)